MAKNIAKYLKQIADNLPDIKVRFSDLTENEILVGVPADSAKREDSDEPNNAVIAYINDNGSPAQNIPARPFMRPGIESAKTRILQKLKNGAKAALSGDKAATEATLQACGLIAQAAIRNTINQGIPPPLSEDTLKGRINSRKAIKGAKAELKSREEGSMPSVDLAKPLVATGQLRNSINYVIRKRNGSA